MDTILVTLEVKDTPLTIEILRIFVPVVGSLFIAWFIWNKQRKYDKRMQIQKEKERCAHLMSLIADDFKIGIRNEVAIAMMAIEGRELFLTHRLFSSSKTSEIAELSLLDINVPLLKRINLVYDHFNFMNSMIQEYNDNYNLAKSGGSHHSNIYKEKIANNILHHSFWAKREILPLHNAIIRDIENLGHSDEKALAETELQRCFKEVIKETNFQILRIKIADLSNAMGYDFILP